MFLPNFFSVLSTALLGVILSVSHICGKSSKKYGSGFQSSFDTEFSGTAIDKSSRRNYNYNNCLSRYWTKSLRPVKAAGDFF